MEPIYFSTPGAFREWLEAHHDKAEELWVGYWKKATGKPSLTWPQSVDQALCFGWIDGVRYRVDDERYKIRFTPRKPSSIWSAVNMNRFPELEAAGMVHPAGRAAWERRSGEKSKRYAYERENIRLTPAYLKRFKANEEAWAFFRKLPPSVRKPSMWYVMSAKKEATRERRLATLIACSTEGRRIPPLRRRRE